MSTCAADANRAARFGCVTKALYLKAEGAQFATAVHVASLHVGRDAHCNDSATIARTTIAELPLLNERAAAVHTQRSMTRTPPHDTHAQRRGRRTARSTTARRRAERGRPNGPASSMTSLQCTAVGSTLYVSTAWWRRMRTLGTAVVPVEYCRGREM